MLKNFLGKIGFNLLWLPLQIFIRVIFQFKIESKEDLKEMKPPLIVVINHTSWLDPFLAGLVFPFNSKVYPIRYATWHKYYYYPLFFPFLAFLATFPIQTGIGLENSLKEAIKILKGGGVIGIFPEGKRRHFGRPRRGRRGAAFLALNLGAPILPIKIEGLLGIGFPGIFLQWRKVKIKVGKKFYLPSNMNHPDDLDKATELIIDKLRST